MSLASSNNSTSMHKQTMCHAPQAYQPRLRVAAVIALMRLDKPWGTILLLWPTLWALWLANRAIPSLKLLSVFLIGGILMRACGCVINDYCDQDIDSQVQRTQTRPLAAQTISKKATMGLGLILALAALSLLPWLNPKTRYLAVIGFVLTCIYPTSKRWLHCPQLFLGVTFAWGIPMAFSESAQGLNSLCWLVYATTMLWIVGYDTIYAMQDYADDLKLPIHTMPKLLGGRIQTLIRLTYGGVLLGLIGIGVLAPMQPIFGLFCLCAYALLYRQQVMIASAKADSYLSAFKLNQWVGAIIWLGVVYAQA